MKKIKILLLVGCVSSVICACGMTQKADTTTVSIHKDGGITETIVEDFSKDYYNADELEKEIQAQITEYNSNVSSGGDGAKQAITLENIELDDNKVIRVEMDFQSSEDYRAFNEKELFCGTVADAYSGGYEFTSMRDVSQEGVVLSAADVLEKGEMHIVIVEEAQQIIVPGKIKYISDGVSVIEEKRAVNLNEGQKAFILYE